MAHTLMFSSAVLLLFRPLTESSGITYWRWNAIFCTHNPLPITVWPTPLTCAVVKIHSISLRVYVQKRNTMREKNRSYYMPRTIKAFRNVVKFQMQIAYISVAGSDKLQCLSDLATLMYAICLLTIVMWLSVDRWIHSLFWGKQVWLHYITKHLYYQIYKKLHHFDAPSHFHQLGTLFINFGLMSGFIASDHSSKES